MKIASMGFSERHLQHLGQMAKKHKTKPANYLRKLIEDDIEKNKTPFDNLNGK